MPFAGGKKGRLRISPSHSARKSCHRMPLAFKGRSESKTTPAPVVKINQSRSSPPSGPVRHLEGSPAGQHHAPSRSLNAILHPSAQGGGRTRRGDMGVVGGSEGRNKRPSAYLLEKEHRPACTSGHFPPLPKPVSPNLRRGRRKGKAEGDGGAKAATREAKGASCQLLQPPSPDAPVAASAASDKYQTPSASSAQRRPAAWRLADARSFPAPQRELEPPLLLLLRREEAATMFLSAGNWRRIQGPPRRRWRRHRGKKRGAPPPKRASLGGAKQQRGEAFRWGPAWPRGSTRASRRKPFLSAAWRYCAFRRLGFNL